MIRKGTAGNSPVSHIGLAVPITFVLETRYGEVDPLGNQGQNRLLLFQVSGDNTVPGKSKDPAGVVALAGLARFDLFTMAIRFDFERPVSPAAGDGPDTIIVKSQAGEQVFDVPGCYSAALNDWVP